MRVVRCRPDIEFNRRLFGLLESVDIDGLASLLKESGADRKVNLHATFKCPGDSQKPRWKNIFWFVCKQVFYDDDKLKILSLILNTSGARGTLNSSLAILDIAEIRQMNLARPLRLLREFGADPSTANHLGLNTLHLLLRSKKYCNDTVRAIFHGLSLDEAVRLVDTPYPEDHGITKWRGLKPVEIAEQEGYLHEIVPLLKQYDEIEEWRPRSDRHRMFSKKLRLQIRMLMMLAHARFGGKQKSIKEDGTFDVKYPKACLALLPSELLQYLCVFVASPPFPVMQNPPALSDALPSNMQNQALFLPLERNRARQKPDEEASALDFSSHYMRQVWIAGCCATPEFYPSYPLSLQYLLHQNIFGFTSFSSSMLHPGFF